MKNNKLNSSAKSLKNEKIKEFDRLAPTIYGNILKQVPQENIANNIFEKVMLEELTLDTSAASTQSPLLSVLNKARKRSKKTIDALNLFRDCCAGQIKSIVKE